MNPDIHYQSLANPSPRSFPYASSISSSTSSSSSSVFSVDAASQSSCSTSSTSQSIPIGWESEEWSSGAVLATNPTFQGITRSNTFPLYKPCQKVLPAIRTDVALPSEQRQNPRRSSISCHRVPPPLVRQAERKLNFVDCLVDSATQIVEVIWPLSVPSSRCESASGRGVLPLRTFIQETLRRSRTSYSTLQVALYYLILIKPHVPKHDFTMEQPEDVQSLRALQCGRRMFLAALILASKYLQDRNYSARAWSKISSLKVCEINANEMAFLSAVNWKLHITDPVWERWQEVVLRNTPSPAHPPSPGACLPNSWRVLMPFLTPELDQLGPLGFAPRAPVPDMRSDMRTSLRLLPPPSVSSTAESATPSSSFKAPRFLEPKPDLLPPTPNLIRMGPLPTPSLTPQPLLSTTPAASVLSLGSRRPSMCSAMAQAQSSSLARSCVDQFNPSIRNGLEAYHFPTSRRPSVATSSPSMSSSPESMIFDNASRSSRASSISSVSSANWAQAAKLARLATCRSARLPFPTLQKCKEVREVPFADPMSSPDIEVLHIEDVEARQLESPESSPTAVPAKSRKRGRSSVDLQQNVRHLLRASISVDHLSSRKTVFPDRTLAMNFPTLMEKRFPDTMCKGLQSVSNPISAIRLPMEKDLGRKRACCGSNVAPTFLRQGPGMWEGIL